MANIMDKLASKLGLKPPPEQKPRRNLLGEGQFGPAEGQPPASLGVETFAVLALGLDEPQLQAASARVVANTRKIIGEARRAYLYAAAIQRAFIAVEEQSFRTPPPVLGPGPPLYPRSMILRDLQALEDREAMHKATYAQTTSAATVAGQQQALAIAKAGGEAAYQTQQYHIQRAAEILAKEKAEWTALAVAGDPAAKAWIAWQAALGQYNAANSNYVTSSKYATTPEAKANAEQLRQRAAAAKTFSDALGVQFADLKRQRDVFVAKQQIAAGTHPLQVQIAQLSAKRLDKTQQFTVDDNVALSLALQQLNYLKGV